MSAARLTWLSIPLLATALLSGLITSCDSQTPVGLLGGIGGSTDGGVVGTGGVSGGVGGRLFFGTGGGILGRGTGGAAAGGVGGQILSSGTGGSSGIGGAFLTGTGGSSGVGGAFLTGVGGQTTATDAGSEGSADAM
jgi:hypothetical protein